MKSAGVEQAAQLQAASHGPAAAAGRAAFIAPCFMRAIALPGTIFAFHIVGAQVAWDTANSAKAVFF